MTIDQVDLTASNQLEELSNNPMVVAARLKKLTEVLSAVPEKYEAAIQSKARKFQELTTRAHQDLYVLKEELQKAKTALNSTETITPSKCIETITNSLTVSTIRSW